MAGHQAHRSLAYGHSGCWGRGLLLLLGEVAGTKGNPFEATTWRRVVEVGLAAEVGAGSWLSSAIARLEQGGGALVAKLREVRSVDALGAFV
jgi:hypothetical protein